MEYFVTRAATHGIHWKAMAYQGAGTSFPVESKITENKAEAEDWAARANAGEAVPEAGWGSYADD